MHNRFLIALPVLTATLLGAFWGEARFAHAVPRVPNVPRVEPPKAVLEFEDFGRPGQPKQRRSVVRFVEVREADLREEPVRFRMPKRFEPSEPVVFKGTVRVDDPLSFQGGILAHMYVMRKDGTKVITNSAVTLPEYDRHRVSFRLETEAPATAGEHLFKIFLSLPKSEDWDLFVSKMIVEKP